MALNATANVTALELGAGQTLTLSGGGTLSLSNNQLNVIYGVGSTLINQGAIQGSGTIGGTTGIGNTQFVLMNSGTINASQAVPLTIDAAGDTGTNAGTLEATGGATLVLESSLTNTGGTILATGTGSQVELVGMTVAGGTLTTASGGLIVGESYGTLDGSTDPVTISAGSTFEVPNASTVYLAGTITNNGNILVDGSGSFTSLQLGGYGQATLAGTGTVTLANSSQNAIGGTQHTYTLTNQETIQGSGFIGWGQMSLVNSGVIDANQSTLLEVKPDAGTVNTGTLEATQGATLELYKYHVTNAGGTILASGNNSQVTIYSATIAGGTLSTNSGGLILAESNATLAGDVNPLTLSAGSSLQIPDGQLVNLQGSMTNNGTITLNSSGNLTQLAISGGVTLTGTGILSLSNNTTNQVAGSTTGATLTNAAIIQGSGNLGNGKLGLLNQGTIQANQSIPLVIDPSAGGKFNNEGILKVDAGATLQITGSAGAFVNFNSTSGKLTGGTYQVTGTLQISTPNSRTNNLVTNAASITLTGPSAQILNQLNTSALSTFASNLSAGSFTLAGSQNFTSAGAFSNAGTVLVSSGSTFTVAGSGSYVQTSGTTTVDGTLATSSSSSFRSGDIYPIGAGSINLQGGSLFGNGGSLSASVFSNGALTPADSPITTGRLTIAGNYTQNANGALNANVAGATQFNQLAVSGTASLGGTLNVGLLNGFVPSLGATFQILTASAVKGAFSTVNGASINGSEHFTVNYNSKNVTLTVVSGP